MITLLKKKHLEKISLLFEKTSTRKSFDSKSESIIITCTSSTILMRACEWNQFQAWIEIRILFGVVIFVWL